MNTKLAALALLPVLLTPSCQSGYIRGGVNGVRFQSTVNRDPVPGGTGRGIRVQMDGDRGWLWVDEVSFGPVRRGDRVRVTKQAEVLINGAPRTPQAKPEGNEAERTLSIRTG